MNEWQAKDKGYEYTGIYERDSDKAKKELESIRKSGYKAVLVTVPDSPLSRGIIGKGYSVYVEKRYNTDQKMAELEKELKGMELQRSYTRKEFEKALNKIDEREQYVTAWLDKLKKE